MTVSTVAITGLGLVTPAGVGVPASWAAICGGRGTALREQDDTPGPGPQDSGKRPAYVTCRVPGFDADALLGAQRARRLERFSQFALVAAAEALADAGLDAEDWDGTRVGVVLGTAFGGVHAYTAAQQTVDRVGAYAVSPLMLPLFLPNMVAGQAALAFRATGPCLTVSTACASGATALGTARDLLLAGRCDVVVAGGTDASLTPAVLAGFGRLGALADPDGGEPAAASRPFDTARDGFVTAEGAGVLILERETHARSRGARVHARLAGYGATADAHHPVAPHPRGAGLEAAVRGALADAGLCASAVDHVNAHATGTPRGDAVEADVLQRLFPHRPPVTSVKGVTGHTLGAAGAIEAVCSVLSVARATLPPTANLAATDPGNGLDIVRRAVRREVATVLTTSVGFGGQNAALVVTAP
ncbi:beta-ketoacyl-[acyl-carrier-protein] synthase family protein (plasmid) [Streptomyces sp. CA-294286]|uniref:beta-ketoacyl-[acyl-carrier-protein] synthase family protein n=1 Tax=Streptomyces sp. CA-294286 TaxID=3240070 RepID=UPI003D8F6FE4